MVFSNLFFLYVFLPVLLILYYLLPGILAKNICLLLFSLIFYAWGEPVYIVLMLIAIAVNFLLGILIENEPRKKKRTLVFALIWNLFLLGFFKYSHFLVDTFNALTGASIFLKELPLPIGISFYTFQAMSYLIDLYRGKYSAQKNILKFALYISMYFQLIAGPIIRYHDVEKQLSARKTSAVRLGEGLARFMLGLGKKVLLANTFGELFALAWNSGTVSMMAAWLGTLACTLQIYFDFSGYSDMAIGLGHAFGFDFPENFKTPYLAGTVTDFWRRWHISLGSWFREYVYIPLGGNRVSVSRHILNIFIVWLLTGLWHGADWTFIIWGLYYAVLLILEKYLPYEKVPAFIRHILTLLFVMAGWVIFFSDDLGQAGIIFTSMFGLGNTVVADRHAFWLLQQYGLVLAIGIAACMPVAGKIRDEMFERHPGALAASALILLALSTAFLVSQNYNPFLYFRF